LLYWSNNSFGRPGVTYESAQTLKYQLSHTEVICSARKLGQKRCLILKREYALFSFLFVPWKFQLKPTRPFFCYRAMPIASINYSVKPFVDLFNTWHGQLMVKVSIVISSDKKMLKEGEPVPEIFTDPVFGQSSHW
jgi:carnitine O-acetyltransferase